MEGMTRGLFRLSGHRFPLWTRYTPSGARKLDYTTEIPFPGQPEMVYFPSCITRTMGASADYEEKAGVTEKTISLLHKAGTVFAIRRISIVCAVGWLSVAKVSGNKPDRRKMN